LQAPSRRRRALTKTVAREKVGKTTIDAPSVGRGLSDVQARRDAGAPTRGKDHLTGVASPAQFSGEQEQGKIELLVLDLWRQPAGHAITTT